MLDYQYGNNLDVEGDPHGCVTLLDVMGSDSSIVKAARTSYDGDQVIDRNKDRGLIRYLMRHQHTGPFEMAEMLFELKMPIFVARQWVRHRTASMNEVSARYTQLPNEMFVPEVLAAQSADNKQGRDENLYRAGREIIAIANEKAYATYEALLAGDVSREQARGVLPLNVYTRFVWKMDLHNLMHFLKLRLDPHAQKEIRVYAEVIERLVALKFPLTYEAFVDYQRDAYTCSRMEMEVIHHVMGSLGGYDDSVLDLSALCEEYGMSKREIVEFKRRFFDG